MPTQMVSASELERAATSPSDGPASLSRCARAAIGGVRSDGGQAAGRGEQQLARARACWVRRRVGRKSSGIRTRSPFAPSMHRRAARATNVACLRRGETCAVGAHVAASRAATSSDDSEAAATAVGARRGRLRQSRRNVAMAAWPIGRREGTDMAGRLWLFSALCVTPVRGREPHVGKGCICVVFLASVTFSLPGAT